MELALQRPIDLGDAMRDFMERFRGILRTGILHINTAVRNTLADAFAGALDAGTAGVIQIYDGSMPATPATAISTQQLLATLTFSATSFGAASSGVITANAITADSSCDQSGTAAWARISTQSGGTVIADVDVGTSGTVMIFSTVAFVIAANISCSAFTFTMPAS